MITLHLYLEDIQGDWFGWIEDCPGAFCQGTTAEDAARAASCVLNDYLHWLRAQDEPPPTVLNGLTNEDVYFEVGQVYRALRGQSGQEINAFFPIDALPLDDEGLETTLRLLRHTHADLHKAVSTLPPDQWDSAPFGGKSIRSLLTHLAEREQFVLSRLNIPFAIPASGEPLERLLAARLSVEQSLRAMPDARRNRPVIVEGEVWTLRKVLRRILWHVRYHTAQIADRTNPSRFFAVVQAISAGSAPHTPSGAGAR